MKLSARRPVAAAPSAVRAVLHDFGGWAAWIPGCQALELEPQADGSTDVFLTLRAPRTLFLRVAVERTEGGIRYALVQGDASTAAGEVVVSEADAGAEVRWDQTLEFPVVVPRPLLRELEDETVPRWLAALDAAAREG